MENSLTIKIPPNGDPKYWFKFINKYIIGSQTEISNLIIDFNTVNFLDTDDIVLLACLLDLYYREDLNIKFINGTAYLNKHLSGIKFKKYWSKDFAMPMPKSQTEKDIFFGPFEYCVIIYPFTLEKE